MIDDEASPVSGAGSSASDREGLAAGFVIAILVALHFARQRPR